MANWPDLVTAYWGRCDWLRSPEQVQLAGDEMRSFWRNPTRLPTNDELCSTIRWLAGPENKLDRCPTLRQLIRAVCIRRKQEAMPDVDADVACSCNKGWVTVYPEAPDVITVEQAGQQYRSQVPCLCAKGQGVITKCRDFSTMSDVQANELRRLAIKGRAQARALAGEMP